MITLRTQWPVRIEGPVPRLATRAAIVSVMLVLTGCARREAIDPYPPVGLVLARHSATTRETLDQLIQSRDPAVNAAIIANHAVEAESIGRMADAIGQGRTADERALALAIARHPETPVVTVERLAAISCPRIDRALIEHPGVSERVLAQLAGRHRLSKPPSGPDYRASVDLAVNLAEHPATPPQALASLCRLRHPRILFAVSAHPHTDARTRQRALKRLANWPNGWDVRARVAGYHTLPPRLLERLADDPEWRVKQAVAANPAAPPAVIERMAVQLAAHAGESRPPVNGGTQGGSELYHRNELAFRLARHPAATPRALEHLAALNNWRVNRAILERVNE